MNFYYFKFGEGNFPIQEMNPEQVTELGIFWGAWTIDEYRKNPDVAMGGKKQSSTFINEIKPSDFLIVWFKDMVNFYQVIDNVTFDNYQVPYSRTQNNPDEPCKVRKVQHHSSHKKEELPDFFYRLNSNQKYNRRTIEKINGPDEDIAKFLCSNKKEKIKITAYNYLKYISPIEFESYIALSLWEADKYPGTYRGGTIKDVDLIVYKNGKRAEPERYYQIKYKDMNQNKNEVRNGVPLIYVYPGMDNPPWPLKPEGRIKQWLLNLYNPDIFDVEL